MKNETFKLWLKNNGWISEGKVSSVTVCGEVFTKRENGAGSAGAWVEFLDNGLVTRGFVNSGSAPLQPEVMAELSDFTEEISPTGKLQFVAGKNWRSAP
jgi:hypothetical protein